MKTKDLKSLLETVEGLRGKMYPELEKTFLEAVVQAEEANPEDDAEAVTAIEKALAALLKAKGVT
jgi:hypothetical protein